MSILALLLAAGVTIPTVAWTYEASCASTYGSYTIQAACWSGSQFVLAGQGPDSVASGYGQIMTVSADGATYTKVLTLSSSVGKNFYSIASDGAGSCIAGTNGARVYYNSTYGTGTWTENTSMSSSFGDHTIFGITYADSRYMLVGDSGRVAYAASGVSGNCTAQTISGWSGAVNASAFGNSKWVVVGASGQCAVSTDHGATWVTNTGLSAIFGSNGVLSITYGNGLFVAVGGGGLIATSPDGATWTARTGTWGTSSARQVLFNGNYFIVFANSGQTAFSAYGIAWASQTGLSSTTWGTTTPYCAAYSPTVAKFFVAGASGKGALSNNS